jgi:hypothetical protein
MARLDRRFPPGPLAATPAVPAAGSSSPTRSAAPRAALAVSVLLAVVVAHFAADGEASARAVAADPELARLLRAMAFIKASMAAAAVWLADRLLRHQPLGAGLAAGLVAAVALMAAAPVLMWHVAHVGTGALMFHAGMVLVLVLGWRPSEAWLASRSGRRSR